MDVEDHTLPMSENWTRVSYGHRPHLMNYQHFFSNRSLCHGNQPTEKLTSRCASSRDHHAPSSVCDFATVLRRYTHEAVSSFSWLKLKNMSLWNRILLVVIGAIGCSVLAVCPSQGFDTLWSTVLSNWVFPMSELHVSILSLAGETGLQLATASATEAGGKSFRFGLGYDDMVGTSRSPLDGSNVPPAISERLFLLTTPCDKRFQFTIRITW